MTLIYLLRHAESSANRDGILAGRIPGIGLSAKGQRDSRLIAKELKALTFKRIYQSPLERCRETINPYLKEVGRRAVTLDDFVEMDYGRWSGRKLSELRREPLWKTIQSRPTKAKFPGGESFRDAARRIKRGMDEVSRSHKKGPVLVVSHGDPIKIAAQIVLGGEIDKFQKIVIDPASVTIIDWPNGTLLGLNLPISAISKAPRVGSEKNLEGRKALGGGTDGSARF